MIHKVLIYARDKETGKYFIEDNMQITDEDIEDMSLKLFKENHAMKVNEDKYEYSATLDKRIFK